MAAPPSPTGDEPVPAGQGSSRSGAMMMCAAAGLLLAASLISGQDGSPDASSPPRGPQSVATAPQAADSPTRPAASAPPAGQPAGKHLPRSRPVRLRIPKIWVDAPFTDLHIGPTGQLEPPPAADTNLVGWHVEGASPARPERRSSPVTSTPRRPRRSSRTSASCGRATSSPSCGPTGAPRPSGSTAWRPSKSRTSPANACTATPRRPRCGSSPVRVTTTARSGTTRTTWWSSPISSEHHPRSAYESRSSRDGHTIEER